MSNSPAGLWFFLESISADDMVPCVIETRTAGRKKEGEKTHNNAHDL